MSKKSHKIAAVPRAKTSDLPSSRALPEQSAPRSSDVQDPEFQKIVTKILKTHGEVLRRLAEYDRNG